MKIKDIHVLAFIPSGGLALAKKECVKGFLKTEYIGGKYEDLGDIDDFIKLIKARAKLLANIPKEHTSGHISLQSYKTGSYVTGSLK